MQKFLAFVALIAVFVSCSNDNDKNTAPIAPLSFKIDGTQIVFPENETTFIITHGEGDYYTFQAQDQNGNYVYFDFTANTKNMQMSTFHYDPAGPVDYHIGQMTSNAQTNTVGHLVATFRGQIYMEDENGDIIMKNVTEGKINGTYEPIDL